jgi:hypothetical protein
VPVFRRLDSVQAAALIGGHVDHGRVGEMSLAEVFERRGDVTRVRDGVGDEARPGQYL